MFPQGPSLFPRTYVGSPMTRTWVRPDTAKSLVTPVKAVRKRTNLDQSLVRMVSRIEAGCNTMLLMCMIIAQPAEGEIIHQTVSISSYALDPVLIPSGFSSISQARSSSMRTYATLPSSWSGSRTTAFGSLQTKATLDTRSKTKRRSSPSAITPLPPIT